MAAAKTDANVIEGFARFDLISEIADAERKKPWQAGHYAKTLCKTTDFRTVLITMDPGAKMKEHHADGTISVQVLKGDIRFAAQGNKHDLRTGSLITLGASIPHDIEAFKESAFLLTISWPPAEQLRAMEHRGYGT